MRPGLSGLAQVNMGYTGESEADTRSKLSFDLYYILRFSLALDIQIALKTLFRLARSSR
jgi:lipopolysaccharide/colanic/teichoic acid biosynthesis glycosyltransferase